VAARSGALDAVKAFEQPRDLLVADARAGVRDLQGRAVARQSQAHGDRSVERELEGVREEVEDDLLPHVPIDVDVLAERRCFDHQADTRALDRSPEAARQVRRERR